jgi:hypothetical protein
MNDTMSDGIINDEEMGSIDELNRMGSAWFVLRAYCAYVDSREKRWNNTATVNVRENAFFRTLSMITAEGEKMHRYFLSHVINQENHLRLNHNTLGVTGDEILTLANEILERNPSLSHLPETYMAIKECESMPSWLADYSKGDEVPLEAFLSSRTVFYPGSWFDTEPMKIFGCSGSAHAFIYADYNASENPLFTGEGFCELFKSEFQLEGYRVLDMVQYDANKMNGAIKWRPHLTAEDYRNVINLPRYTNQFSYFVVLEKEPSSVETLGPDRLALWFISGDGVATYDAVYAYENAIPPFVFVHQDHGFGGNYTNFGNDGLLHAIAERSNVYPRFILHGQGGTGARWAGYNEVDGVTHTRERDRSLLSRM